MSQLFKKIGLICKKGAPALNETVNELISYLQSKADIELFISNNTNSLGKSHHKVNILPNSGDLPALDLVIVIGGDGTLLHVARQFVDTRTPIVGINKGRLGFLADINPEHAHLSLDKILAGDYHADERHLIAYDIIREGHSIQQGRALNDIVLYAGEVARLIEFEIHINSQYVATIRADGLITATPTGSTAYALSAGGPITYPTLGAMVLVPMQPHLLSARPLTIPKEDTIELCVTQQNKHLPKLSYDGQPPLDLILGDVIQIKQYPTPIKLIHPVEYNYYEVLRNKLGWSNLR